MHAYVHTYICTYNSAHHGTQPTEPAEAVLKHLSDTTNTRKQDTARESVRACVRMWWRDRHSDSANARIHARARDRGWYLYLRSDDLAGLVYILEES